MTRLIAVVFALAAQHLRRPCHSRRFLSRTHGHTSSPRTRRGYAHVNGKCVTHPPAATSAASHPPGRPDFRAISRARTQGNPHWSNRLAELIEGIRVSQVLRYFRRRARRDRRVVTSCTPDIGRVEVELNRELFGLSATAQRAMSFLPGASCWRPFSRASCVKGICVVGFDVDLRQPTA